MSYPLKEEECLQLFEELKKLDASSSAEFSPRKYEIIHDLAEARFFEAKPYFVSGLNNPDPDYRWACVSALVTHWQESDQRIVDRLVEMAKFDSDTQVRMIAISSLGFLKVKSAKPMLEELSKSSTEDPDIAQAAREALSML